MIMYLIKSSLCLLIMWGFYALFLERENMHVVKRFYLLFSIVFSLCLPLITLTYTVDVPLEQEVFVQTTHTPVMIEDEIAPIPTVNYIAIVLWSIYGIGVLIFGFRFHKNLKDLILKIKNNDHLEEPSHINVLLGDAITPHTFLKYIFVSKKAYQENEIPLEVLHHERTHVIQKHTLDVLFVEILQVLFWFNPLFQWIKKSIKLNHEFLADQTVLKKQEFSLHTYMKLLVSYPNNLNQVELSSPINYSLTKKRIVMMSQQFSKKRATAKLLLFLPLLTMCIFLFNNEIIAQQKKVKYTKTIQDTHPDKKIKIRVKGEQITVNGTATTLSGFTDLINKKTDQWKDNELTEFQFDVQIVNSNDTFVQKLNDEYRKTRLYKANPDGHDLIPPAPEEPKLPVLKTDVARNLPPQPKKVNKEVKNILPPKAPQPPKPPVSPAYSEDNDIDIEEVEAEIEEAVELALVDINQEVIDAEIESEREVASVFQTEEYVREAAEYAREKAMEEAQSIMENSERIREMARRQAELSREEAEKIREMVRMQAELSREEAERVREMALKEAKMAQKEIRLDRERLRQEARRAADQARRGAEAARREAAEEARKAQGEARKAALTARKLARKEVEKARREVEKARRKAERERNR